MKNHSNKSRLEFSKTKFSVVLISFILVGSAPAVSAKTVAFNANERAVIGLNNSLLQPRIQVAILLDTSGSMDGLINQTRNQLWQVVNEFSTAKQNGVKPILEVALFEYGNDNNSVNNGFVRKLNSFTRELDKVSEGLFSLTTNGGSEYCGYAIQTAVNNLQWSTRNSDIKTIFIAGNEPFTQGPVNYREALQKATNKGISVNTIHAGNYQTGIQTGWQSGALLAGGDYMSIDANRKVVHIKAPQDKVIAQLNTQLNQTYIPYGKKGKDNKQRQQKQDALSSDISSGLLAKRVRSKSSSFYKNSSWDLVDAMEQGKIDSDALVKLEESDLPEPMKKMTVKQKQEYVVGKAKQRKNIQRQIAELSQSREEYVAEAKAKLDKPAAPSVSDALTQSIRKQASEKDFKFEK